MPESSDPIPFHRPWRQGGEADAVAAAVRSSSVAGDGPFTRRCEAFLAGWAGVPRVLLTHSGAGALDLVSRLLGWGPGDEVILPAFTFATTVNPILLCGARPVLVDSSPQTLNLDPEAVARALGPRTRAVVAVSYGGVPPDLHGLGRIARDAGAVLVEDAGLAFGSRFGNRPVGSLGKAGVWSFHGSRTSVQCGEGGALVLADPELVERAERLRERGTTRQALLRGQAAEYAWFEPGSSSLPSDLAAAWLSVQLQHVDDLVERLRRRYRRYHRAFADLHREGRLRLPEVPPPAHPNGGLFFCLLPDETTRDRVVARLRSRGIPAGGHYRPLHEEPGGAGLGRCRGKLPVCEELSRRLLRLPLYARLSGSHQGRIVRALREALG